MTVVTLTTDFGLADSYVAAMKGVILNIAPNSHIVDVTHLVPPQDVPHAAHVLRNAVPYFPRGTIHVAVVDPGVGSQRRPIAVQTADALFVGPDNGVFSHVLAGPRTVEAPVSEPDPGAACLTLHLDDPRYWLTHVSHTFHGRDIFAPVAAHLAAGVPFQALGTPIDDPVTIPWPEPSVRPNGSIDGEIIYCDHFGNLVSNVPAEWLAGRPWQVLCAGYQLPGPRPSYASVGPGQPVALIGSAGTFEIAVRDGSASRVMGVGVGEPVEVWPRERE